jgi:tRNA (guanine26-N2/guanine27-N2)-dimethyltransferase
MEYAGPLWLGRIFDAKFVGLMAKENGQRAFRNSAKITKLLTLTREEAEMPPNYYVLDRLSGKFGLPAPSTAAFFEALRAGGFKAVATHFNSRGVRTDAPASAMQTILKNLTNPANAGSGN